MKREALQNADEHTKKQDAQEQQFNPLVEEQN
jgi:hypothetical protein